MDEDRRCEVCGRTEMCSMDTLGVGLVVNERTCKDMCIECDFANGGPDHWEEMMEA